MTSTMFGTTLLLLPKSSGRVVFEKVIIMCYCIDKQFSMGVNQI